MYASSSRRLPELKCLSGCKARWRYSPDIPLDEMIGMMNPSERKFFDVLDKELEKVEAFYEEREAEAIERCKVLREQLQQLAEHREEYLAKHSGPSRLVRPFLEQVPNGVRKRLHTKDGYQDSANESPAGTSPITPSYPEPKRGPLHLPAHLNPETYVIARRKLKLATFETCACGSKANSEQS